MSDFQGASTTEKPASSSQAAISSPGRVALALAWAALVATGGGWLCGLAIHRFGEVGSVALWGLGAGAGFAARKLVGDASKAVAWSLVAACTLAFVFAEVCWIHWNVVGAETWWSAAMLLGKFAKTYSTAAIVGSVATILGALSAYRQMAYRYRWVAEP